MSDQNSGPGPAHPEQDAEWNRDARNETPAERLDRNWNELVQELRVVQTGVQFLTGFLLTLPFQQRFQQLSDAQEDLYLGTVGASVLATGFLQAPVAVHRALFRRHQRERTVLVAHRVAMAGIFFLALAVIGVVAIIFDVVGGDRAGQVAAALVAVLLLALWLALPLTLRGPVDPSATSDDD